MTENAFAPTCSSGEHCITCGDEGVAMRVLREDADGLVLARREAGSVSEAPLESLVDIALVGEVSSGDLLLVHAGIALVRLGAEAAVVA